jgi:hypothetical protein
MAEVFLWKILRKTFVKLVDIVFHLEGCQRDESLFVVMGERVRGGSLFQRFSKLYLNNTRGVYMCGYEEDDEMYLNVIKEIYF